MSLSSHLARGLQLLTSRWTTAPRAWIKAGKDPLDKAVRALLVGGVGYVLWLLISSSWTILGIVVAVVVVKALRAATKQAREGLSVKAGPEVPEAPVDGFPGDLAAYIRQVLDGAPAVHLTTLADHLHHTTGTAWTGTQVRAACQEAGIPIRPKVRDLGGDRVSSGVHRDDLPPLPQPLPEEAQEGTVDGYVAGHSGNATPPSGGNATTPTRTTRRVGDLRITQIPDADNPHRTHIQVANPTRKKT